MVDKLNPTNQFHPYQPPDATPVAEQPESGIGAMLRKAGLDTTRLNGTSLNQTVTKMRETARRNPGLVLGGIAAAVIGAGLLRRKRTTSATITP
jgi:hypothetical protein